MYASINCATSDTTEWDTVTNLIKYLECAVVANTAYAWYSLDINNFFMNMKNLELLNFAYNHANITLKMICECRKCVLLPHYYSLHIMQYFSCIYLFISYECRAPLLGHGHALYSIALYWQWGIQWFEYGGHSISISKCGGFTDSVEMFDQIIANASVQLMV